MSTEMNSLRNPCAGTEAMDPPGNSGIEFNSRSALAPDDHSEKVVSRLLAASHRLRSVLADHYAQFDLTDVRHAVLQILRNAAPDGLSQSQLAERLGQSESSVCMLVKRMRDAELLYRLRSRHDRRNWVLNLTDRGDSLLRRVEECHGRRMQEMLSGFAPGELKTLSTLLQRFAGEMDRADRSSFKPAEIPGPKPLDDVDVSPRVPAAEVSGDAKLPPAA